MKILRPFRNERGIALVMSLGTLIVLTVVGTSAIYYTSTNTRSATNSQGSTKAYSMSEAGIANAMAILKNPANNPINPNLLPPTTIPYEGGTVTWSGTYDASNGLWTINAAGEVVSNASGPTAKAPARELSAQVRITPNYTDPKLNDAWNWIFVTSTGAACDVNIPSGFTWNSALYAIGDVCLNSNSHIIGGPIVAKQRLNLLANSTYVGTLTTPISAVHVSQGCKYGNQHQHPDPSHPIHPFCSVVDQVYASTLTQTPPEIPIPEVSWDPWYQNASPGPKYPCTYTEGTPPVFDNDTVRNNSVPTVQLMTTTSYRCVVGRLDDPIGELRWDATNRHLTIKGTIFIDGPVQVANTELNTYDGHATLYTSGAFTLTGGSPGTRLCAVASGSNCLYTNSPDWNPNSEMLTVVAGGSMNSGSLAVHLGARSEFQGGLFSPYVTELAANARQEGPLVTSTLNLGSGAITDPYPQILATVPSGSPGQGLAFADVEDPNAFTG
jgi:hypothetical protein